MLTSLEQTLGKTCIVGLSYFDHQQCLIKQNIVAGTVIAADEKLGITLSLTKNTNTNSTEKPSASAQFVIPTSLSCWFIAPAGDYHTCDANVTINNPHYIVTWDIFQTKAKVSERQQQWWHWMPRSIPPQISAQASVPSSGQTSKNCG